MKPNPRRFDSSIYPCHYEMLPRYGDMDPNQHLNNVRLAEFYQEGRVCFHRTLGAPFDPEQSTDRRILIAHQAIDYLREVEYPAAITVTTGVLRIGTTSYTLAAALFQQGNCVGLATTVIVNANHAGTAPLPAELRTLLQQKSLPPDAA
jgi:acyl-CoA thioester hydrolase